MTNEKLELFKLEDGVYNNIVGKNYDDLIIGKVDNDAETEEDMDKIRGMLKNVIKDWLIQIIKKNKIRPSGFKTNYSITPPFSLDDDLFVTYDYNVTIRTNDYALNLIFDMMSDEDGISIRLDDIESSHISKVDEEDF